MAVAINVPFSAAIWVGTGSAGALEQLGYSVNGVTIREMGALLPVHSDAGGGDQPAPPRDFQVLGQVDVITMDLSEYDEAIADKLRALIRGGTAGTPPTPGTLLFANSYSTRLVLISTNYPRNYPRCVFSKEPKEHNHGTKFRVLRLTAEAHKDGSGVLYNTTTS